MCMTAENMKQKLAEKYAVIGMGKTGLSVARYLKNHGHDFKWLDTRVAPANLAAFKHEFSDTEMITGVMMDALLDVTTLVISPGVPVANADIQEAIKNGAEVIGDVELFVRQAQAPIVAITGSNGKSTVTTLLGKMIAGCEKQVLVGGNIGLPVLDLLEQPVPDFYVLELSSFQLETLHSLRAAAACVLNISPDHLDRYNNVDEYAKTKLGIYNNADICVVNFDDAATQPIAQSIDNSKKTIAFSIDEKSNCDYHLEKINGELCLLSSSDILVKTSQLKIQGKHNYANALAALALGDAIGLPREGMLQTLMAFTGLSHRTEWIGELSGAHWFNDSKGTNLGATVAAINGFDAPIILIAGGEGKNADFSVLQAAIKRHGRVKSVVLFGSDANEIHACINSVVATELVDDLNAAVSRAAELAVADDVVLFSPACASFDMFSGFEERGEKFVKAFKGLQA